MKNIIIPFLFLTAILIFACRPEPLEIFLDEEPPQVVVFSQLIPNSVITVVLMKTISSLEFNEDEGGDTLSNDLVNTLLVDSADVRISFEGETEELFLIAPGIYTSINTPQRAGVEYVLDIITREGDTLSSRSTMLERVGFENVTPLIKRSEEDTLVSLVYDFIDPPGDNWYMLNFYKRNTNADTSGLDLNNFFSRGSNIQTRTMLWSDKVFENNNPADTIELPEMLPTDSIVITLSNINEAYYQFLDLRRKSGNLLSELTKEPISYPTNIEGGLGFFNTHFPDVRVYDLNDF